MASYCRYLEWKSGVGANRTNCTADSQKAPLAVRRNETANSQKAPLAVRRNETANSQKARFQSHPMRLDQSPWVGLKGAVLWTNPGVRGSTADSGELRSPGEVSTRTKWARAASRGSPEHGGFLAVGGAVDANC